MNRKFISESSNSSKEAQIWRSYLNLFNFNIFFWKLISKNLEFERATLIHYNKVALTEDFFWASQIQVWTFRMKWASKIDFTLVTPIISVFRILLNNWNSCHLSFSNETFFEPLNPTKSCTQKLHTKLFFFSIKGLWIKLRPFKLEKERLFTLVFWFLCDLLQYYFNYFFRIECSLVLGIQNVWFETKPWVKN